MLRLIEGLPPNVLEIGHRNARRVSKGAHPEGRIGDNRGPIRMLYVIGKEFKSFALEAMWDDAAFGVRH